MRSSQPNAMRTDGRCPVFVARSPCPFTPLYMIKPYLIAASIHFFSPRPRGFPFYAVVFGVVDTVDAGGDRVCTNTFSLFIRGKGGFGGPGKSEHALVRVFCPGNWRRRIGPGGGGGDETME